MKKERGSVTIITLTTILFIIAFVVSTFTIIANRRQAQAEIKKETQAIYESDVDNAEQIYQSYFANENEVIPIQTADQLFSIATNKNIVSVNKIYKYTAAADYRLVNDISFNVSDYITKYPGEFQNSTNWIDIEQQIEKGVFTGTFYYNGNVIAETDANGTKITHSNGISYLEYIESTGTQYIDTRVIPNNNTSLEIKISLESVFTDDSINKGIFGTRTNATSNSFSLICGQNNNLYSGYGRINTATTLQLNKNTLYTIKKDKNTTIVNGTTITKADSQSFTSPYAIALFAVRDGSTNPVFYTSMKLYYCQIYQERVTCKRLCPSTRRKQCSLLI